MTGASQPMVQAALSARLSLEASVLALNAANGAPGGGAIACNNCSSVNMRRSQFDGNTAREGNGGAITCVSAPGCVMRSFEIIRRMMTNGCN